MLPDYHLHSKFSSDSTEEPENVIKKSIELGMKSICFTDHMDYGYPVRKEEPDLTFCLDIKEYTKKLSALKKKYNSKIDVLIGIELGIMPNIADKNREIISSYPFDYVIASTHQIEGKDPYFKEFWEGRDINKILIQYFEEMLACVEEFDDYDCLGHMDYIARYIPDKSYIFNPENYKTIIDTILKTIIKKGKGIEINTAGYRYNMGRTNPGTDILMRYKNLGGKIITIGSDAHKAADVGTAFDKVSSILGKCGFTAYYTYKNRKPIVHKS